MSYYQELPESQLTPEELTGKKEFDSIAERHNPLIRDAEHELEAVCSFRDDAEDELLEKSPNARAYVKRILAHHAENELLEQEYKHVETALEQMRSETAKEL
jgi:hypothetical protein